MQAPGDGEGQGNPAYYCPRGHKESDTTRALTTIIVIRSFYMSVFLFFFFNFGFCLFACLFFNRQCGVGERGKNKEEKTPQYMILHKNSFKG